MPSNWVTTSRSCGNRFYRLILCRVKCFIFSKFTSNQPHWWSLPWSIFSRPWENLYTSVMSNVLTFCCRKVVRIPQNFDCSCSCSRSFYPFFKHGHQNCTYSRCRHTVDLSDGIIVFAAFESHSWLSPKRNSLFSQMLPADLTLIMS